MPIVIEFRVSGTIEHAFIQQSDPAVLDALARIESAIKTLGDTMSAQLDTLKNAVESENTVIDSAITLLNGLSAQIVALKDDPVALQALADEVAGKSQALADAVTANTPTPTPTP